MEKTISEKLQKVKAIPGVAECLDMCPKTEIRARSTLEEEHMVKEFVRSAAGKEMNDPKLIRPNQTLWITFKYMMYQIKGEQKYNFIADRSRQIM